MDIDFTVMSRIKKYEHVAKGGEKVIQYSDLIGRKILRVRRDGVSKKIRQGGIIGNMSDKEVFIGISGLIGTVQLKDFGIITFAGLTSGMRLQKGEIIEVLYR